MDSCAMSSKNSGAAGSSSASNFRNSGDLPSGKRFNVSKKLTLYQKPRPGACKRSGDVIRAAPLARLDYSDPPAPPSPFSRNGDVVSMTSEALMSAAANSLPSFEPSGRMAWLLKPIICFIDPFSRAKLL